ncbi:MAG: ATP-binding protein [Candidatus Saelkia tenebricola]|nr:ATP-binding protein [Candidatus Saelkia tenebricola]
MVNIRKKVRIQTKLTAAFLTIAVSVVIVGSIAVYMSQNALQDAIGKNTVLLAEETLRQISQNIFFRIEEIQVYAKDQLLQQYITDSNQEFEILDDIQVYINRHDKNWTSDTESSKEFIQQLESNNLSKKLQEKVNFYENKYGYMVFSEIFITNRYGANIAQTKKTEDYYQADEIWWQKAKEERVYIGDIEYDQSAGVYALVISVRVDSSKGDFLGIIKAVLNVREIINIVANVQNQSSSHLEHAITCLKLIDQNDRLIYSTNNFTQFESVSQELYPRYGSIDGAQHKRYQIGVGEDGNKKLFSHAHMADYKNFKSLGWRLTIKHNAEKIFAPAYRLRKALILITVFIFALAFLLGKIISHYISKPVLELKDALGKVREGNMDNVPKVTIKSQDEIGDFTNAFNKMIDDLKMKTTSIHKLDEEITIRKNIEHDLQREKKKTETILEATLAGIVLIDAETYEIVEANPMAVKMIGIPKEEIIGKVCHNFICSEEAGKCSITDLNKNINNTERILLRPGGESLPILKTATKISMENKVYIVESFIDITERKEIEKLKDEFISTVSHELRTPLSIIKEGISLVLDGILGDINDQQSDILITAKENINRLARIINDLLDISKIEAGKIDLVKEKVNIVDLINEVVATFKIEAEKKGLKIKSELVDKEITVYSDRDKILQVLINSIGNSLKFTEVGGITVSLRKKDHEIECAVHDTGGGISKEDLPQIFGKFKQVGRTPGPGIKGTGLGLNISKGIIETHDGKIWVESEINKGTTFYFTLPVYMPEVVLKDRIDEKMRQADKNNVQMSVIIMSTIDLNKMEQEALSIDKSRIILQDMEVLIRSILHRKDDIIILDNNSLAIVLTDCSKQNSFRVEGRVEQELKNYLKHENLINNVKLQFCCAAYPIDAVSAEKIIEKARGCYKSGKELS